MDDVYVFKKTLLERYEELSSIFSLKSNIKPSEIQKEWSNFLDVAVEPAGWQAIWKVPRATCDVLKLRYPLSIMGTVNQVYYDELVANFTIEQVEDYGEENDQIQLPDQYDVSLMELFPKKSQENQALNIDRTAEGIDTLRFFYLHIWRAWDSECDVDMDWSKYLETRIKFYFDLISNKMSKRLAVHIKNLLEEANYVFKRRQLIEEEMDDDDDEMNNVPCNNNVKELMHLHYRLKLIRNDLEMLENEDMRQVFESLKFSSNGDGCDSTKRFSINMNEKNTGSKGRTFIVCLEKKFKDLASYISELELNEETPVTTHHSLSDVFEHCSNVKQIFLAPGIHTLNFNENLFGKCTITGTNQKSHLASKVFETTLLTLNGSFVFENISFDCKTSSIGLVIAEGKTILKNCSLYGKTGSSIQEGIIVKENASLILENCTFVNFAIAIQTSKNSNITSRNVTIRDSKIGIDLSNNTIANVDGIKFLNVKQPFVSVNDIALVPGQHVKKLIDTETLKIFNVSSTECENNDTPTKKCGFEDGEHKMSTEETPEKDSSNNDSSIICIDD